MATREQFCTFSVEKVLLAIEVRRVQEVIRAQEMTRVPTAPATIRGLINLRGQLVTAVDLRRRLGLDAAGEDWRPMNVVVRAEGGAVSLLVDAIGDVLELDEGDREPPLETIPPTIRDLLAGIYRLPDRLLLVLDPDRVVDIPAAPPPVA